MARYRVMWFNIDSIVKEEPIIEAASEKEAICKAYAKYPIEERPAPLCSATKID